MEGKAQEDDDIQATPRASKKRRWRLDPQSEPPSLPSTPSRYSRSESSYATDDQESQKSGRTSPSKQFTYMEDLDQPVVFVDIETPDMDIPEPVEAIVPQPSALRTG